MAGNLFLKGVLLPAPEGLDVHQDKLNAVPRVTAVVVGWDRIDALGIRLFPVRLAFAAGARAPSWSGLPLAAPAAADR